MILQNCRPLQGGNYFLGLPGCSTHPSGVRKSDSCGFEWFLTEGKGSKLNSRKHPLLGMLLWLQLWNHDSHLWVHVCVCVCVCVCVWTCTCVYIWVCMCVHTHLSVHVCGCVCVLCAHNACVYMHLCVCTWASICMCPHVCSPIQSRIKSLQKCL